jgi:putative transport protein
MIEILARNPLLLLFLIAAIGYPLGRLKVLGTRPGIATVLFAGLAVGAVDPTLRLPEIVYQLGLVLFIYPIGLASGPAFFASFRRKGLRDNVLVAGGVVFALALTAAIGPWASIDAPTLAGLVAGALTNTPALAGVIETLTATAAPEAVAGLRALPVVGYSIAYPVGVLGVIVALAIAAKAFRADFAAEARTLESLGATSRDIRNRTLVATRTAATGRPLADVVRADGLDVVFTRLLRDRHIELVTGESVLQEGDLVVAVGTPEALDAAEREVGGRSERNLGLDRREIDYRRIFVSSPAIVGRTLRELQLTARFGAMITRIRRGDVELVPRADTALELGDRVRVVARRDRLQAVSDFFGDSYRALAEVDIATFSLGLFAGLLLGLIPIPLPGGITLRLGIAGGPLIAGLVLGARGFSGRLVWTMPYTANLTIRQLGLVLFLAGVGSQAGYAFVQTLASPSGLVLFAAGAAITCTTALAFLWVGHRLVRIPLSLLGGMLAALHTQPAVLGYAVERTGNDLPNLGYATVFPTATLLKIVVAQLLLV